MPPILAETSPVLSTPDKVFRRGEGGILPERGSQAQYDLVQALLRSGMASSQQSGWPLLALMTPFVSGAIGARTQGLYDAVQAAENSDSVDDAGTVDSSVGPRGAKYIHRKSRIRSSLDIPNFEGPPTRPQPEEPVSAPRQAPALPAAVFDPNAAGHALAADIFSAPAQPDAPTLDNDPLGIRRR